jgi:hypothetical protein
MIAFIPSADFVEQHSAELTILILSALLLITLLILVPQLLRAHQRTLEMQHAEHLRMLEQGQAVPPADDRSVAAGRMVVLVPTVVIIVAGTVTCFLVAYRCDYLFSVCLAVWCVAGVVALAAVTGGVALLGRLAQLSTEEEEEDVPKNPLAK